MAATALLLIGTGIAFGAAACGSSTSSTATVTTAANNQAFIAKVNGVCDQEEQRQSLVGAPPKINPSHPSAHDLVAAASYLDKEQTVLQTLLTDLEHLGEPPQNRQTFDGAIAALRSGDDNALVADQAARAGDSNSFKTRQSTYKGDIDQADNLIQSFGTHCGRSHSGSPASGASGGPPTTS